MKYKGMYSTFFGLKVSREHGDIVYRVFFVLIRY